MSKSKTSKQTAGERIAAETIRLPLDLDHEIAPKWLSSRIDRSIASAVKAERNRCLNLVRRISLIDADPRMHGYVSDAATRIKEGTPCPK